MKIKDLKIMIKETMDDNSVLLAKPGLLTEANYERVKNKIENQMVPFVMISAFRGGISKSENLRRQNELEEYARGAGFPWTKMPGSGYVEYAPDPEELGEPQEDGEAEFEVDAAELTEGIESEEEMVKDTQGVEVKENSILLWDEVRPDAGPRGEAGLDLFELAKFLAKKYEQDSFVYGEPVHVERTGERQMLAKLYDKDGKSIAASWAGPWSSLTQIDHDDVFWSAIGSKRAKLTELQDHYRRMPVKSRLDAMKKQHYLNAIKSALKTF